MTRKTKTKMTSPARRRTVMKMMSERAPRNVDTAAQIELDTMAKIRMPRKCVDKRLQGLEANKKYKITLLK